MKTEVHREQSKFKTLSVLDIIGTLVLCASLLVACWLLTIWFERIRADELIVFGSLGLFVLLILVFMLFQWRRHGSVWIGVLQGAILSGVAAVPIFRGEPDMEPIIGPIIISVFGGILSAIAIGIFWLVSKPAKPTAPEIIATSGDSQLAGIRGWLILPAIGLVVSSVLGVVGILASLGSMQKMIDRGYGAYSIAWILVNLGILVYFIIAAVKFFKKRKNAPKTVIRLMVTRLIVSVALFFVGLAVIQSGDALVVISLLRSNNFIGQGIAVAIWVPYFKKSRRVQATFVN